MALFGSFEYDILIAFILGLLGGFAAELIANKGDIEFPHPSKTHYLDAGFVANMFLGGIAALAYFFVFETTDSYKFVGATIGAGVGGSAILTAIKEKISGAITQEIAEGQNEQAEEAAADLEEVSKELDQLKTRASAIGVGTRGAGVTPIQIEVEIESLKNRAEKKAFALKRSAEKARKKLKEL